MSSVIGSLEKVDDLVRGAGLLSTGGGGDPYLGKLLLSTQLEHKKTGVEYLGLEELRDDSLVVCVAGMGAPTVVLESLISKGVWSRLVRRMEEYLGRKIDALIAGEIGGLNTIVPMVTASQLGIPVVDGDGIGRALPRIEMCTFSIYGISLAPMFITNELGEMVCIESLSSNLQGEHIARALTSEIGGGLAEVCTYVMSGAQVKAHCVPNTISMCLEVGASIRRARAESDNPVESLVRSLHIPAEGQHAKLLFDGKISSVRRETRDGWHFATVTLIDMEGSGEKFEIEIQNEYLFAKHNGNIVCMVPDLVCVVDRENAEPITAEKIKYGQRVKVLGLSASPVLRTPKALEIVGPRAFGIEQDFTPIEDLI